MRNTLFLLCLLIFVLSAPVSAAEPVAVAGVLDLRGWDFAADGAVRLHGQWEFFWNDLLAPAFGPDADAPPSPPFIQVPGSWVGYASEDGALGAEGFATYRLRVLLPEEPELALLVPYAQTAYEVWINGVAAGGAGTVGASPETSVPSYRTTVVPLPANEETVDIVLRVSNYHFREGGLLRSIAVDDAERAVLAVQRGWAVGAALFGSSMIIGLYHLVLYMRQRKRRSYLFLSIAAFAIALRTPLTGSQFVQVVWPSLPWTLHLKLEYVTGYVFPAAMVFFFKVLFPREIAPWVPRVWLGLAGAGIVATLVTPPRLSSELIPAYVVLSGVLLVYLTATGALAAARGRDGALILLGGVLAFFVFGGLSLLYYRGYAVEHDLIAHGFFFFLLAQALVLAQRASDAFRREQRLAAENGRLLEQTKQQLLQLHRFRHEMAERELRVRERIADMLHGRTQARLLMAEAKADKAMAAAGAHGNDLRSLLKEIKDAIAQVRSEDIRQASHSLHPASVSAGLVPALETLLKNYGEMFTVHWHVSAEAERMDDLLYGTLTQPTRFRIYRIAEEALNNVARHARADTIWLSLTVETPGEAGALASSAAASGKLAATPPVVASKCAPTPPDLEANTAPPPGSADGHGAERDKTPESPARHASSRCLVLTIRDNGVGIRRENFHPGYGLQSVSALVHDLCGSWALHSRPGAGSLLVVRVPVSTPNRARNGKVEPERPAVK